MENITVLECRFLVERYIKRLGGLSRGQRWVRLWLPLLMIFAIFSSSSLELAVFKIALALLAYLTIFYNCRIILGRRKAIFSVTIFSFLVAAVNFIGPTGPYDELNASPRIIKSFEKIRSSIFLFPDSEKWKQMEEKGYQSYLFISINQKLIEDEVVLLVNGEILGPLQKQKDVIFGSGAYTVPIELGKIKGREHLQVELVFKPRQTIYLASSPLVPIAERLPDQQIFRGGFWRSIPEDMGTDVRLLIELRLADKEKKTLGILY